jgi:peptidyl-tRNA hydrolase, PTH1 family
VKKAKQHQKKNPNRNLNSTFRAPTLIDTLVKLIIGLGNPGSSYLNTRHNVGFHVLDEIASKLKLKIKKNKGQSKIARGTWENEDLILAKPQTYMNRSGYAVHSLLQIFHVPLEDCWVIHDDLDLPPGRLRIKRGGGTGGHKGIASIMEDLGTGNFIRFKIGIGRPLDARPVERFVLEPFEEEEREAVLKSYAITVEAVFHAMNNPIDVTMNYYNQKKLYESDDIPS